MFVDFICGRIIGSCFFFDSFIVDSSEYVVRVWIFEIFLKTRLLFFFLGCFLFKGLCYYEKGYLKRNCFFVL